MTITNNVSITNTLAETLHEYFSANSYSQIAILTDTNTLEHCYPLVRDAIPTHTVFSIQSGEEYKNIDTCVYLWEKMTALSMDRKSLLINLGGGVIGDMGGFVASAYKRGIKFINLPTTLLSMADASVGGKLGIDFQGLKNHIGFFTEPEKIFIASSFLETLPENELRSGFAEIIKHSLIGDKTHWNKLTSSSFQDQDMDRHISHAVEFKAGVVKKDPYEQGLRKILNFGHTIGHAIESYFLNKGDKKLLHGEAIAIGMISEAYLSVKYTGLKSSALEELTAYIMSIFGKVVIDEALIPTIIKLTTQDKKNEGGKTMFTLLSEIGKSQYNCLVDDEDIKESLIYYSKKRG